MKMNARAIVAVLLVAWLAWRWRRQLADTWLGTPLGRPLGTPLGTPPQGTRAHSSAGKANRAAEHDALLAGEHDALLERALSSFHAHYERAFERESCTPESVRLMFAARARVLRALGELRMRLPNDPDAEHALAARAHALDRHMLARIEASRQRCGADLLHPGPVNDAWFGAWYRAANDDAGGVV